MIKYSHRTSDRNRSNSIHSNSRALVFSIASQVPLLEIEINIGVIYRQLKYADCVKAGLFCKRVNWQSASYSVWQPLACQERSHRGLKCWFPQSSENRDGVWSGTSPLWVEDSLIILPCSPCKYGCFLYVPGHQKVGETPGENPGQSRRIVST